MIVRGNTTSTHEMDEIIAVELLDPGTLFLLITKRTMLQIDVCELTSDGFHISKVSGQQRNGKNYLWIFKEDLCFKMSDQILEEFIKGMTDENL